MTRKNLVLAETQEHRPVEERRRGQTDMLSFVHREGQSGASREEKPEITNLTKQGTKRGTRRKSTIKRKQFLVICLSSFSTVMASAS